MQEGVAWGRDRVTTLLDGKPRIASLANLLVLFGMGSVIGLGLFLVTWNFTSQFDKPWVYVMNTLIAMTIKLLLQWFMVLIGTPMAIGIGRELLFQRTGKHPPRTTGDSIDSPLPNSMTVTALATMILATELSKGSVQPIWFVDPSNKLWAGTVVTAIGGLTAVLEGLSVPTTIYALVKNRHAYQDSKGYQRTNRRNGGNRGRSRRNNRKKRR